MNEWCSVLGQASLDVETTKLNVHKYGELNLGFYIFLMMQYFCLQENKRLAFCSVFGDVRHFLSSQD